ncbi:Protein MAK32 [Fusarium odoratissimum]|uniref:Protein MAK32 n=1 Tax=Fusarium oxysporum f. sp. cubense (strain race 4) TaxID=2502994 RepID=N1RIJ2_FUSC4|nr:Protein MAK32 [Fusarium odoratissimum]
MADVAETPEIELPTDSKEAVVVEEEKDIDQTNSEDAEEHKNGDEGAPGTEPEPEPEAEAEAEADKSPEHPPLAIIEGKASDSSGEEAVPIDFFTMGMFIIDDIDFIPPTPPVKDILGGAGTYSALGARLFSPPPKSASVGWIVDQGSDFPPSLSTLIDSWSTSALFRHDGLRLTTRGWNGYEGTAEKREKPVTLPGPAENLIRRTQDQSQSQASFASSIPASQLPSSNQLESQDGDEDLASGAAALAIDDTPISSERLTTFRTALGQLLNTNLFEDDAAELDAVVEAVNKKIGNRRDAFDKGEATKALQKMGEANQIMFTEGDLVYKI